MDLFLRREVLWREVFTAKMFTMAIWAADLRRCKLRRDENWSWENFISGENFASPLQSYCS